MSEKGEGAIVGPMGGRGRQCMLCIYIYCTGAGDPRHAVSKQYRGRPNGIFPGSGGAGPRFNTLPKILPGPRDINKLTLPISAIFFKLELIDRKFGMIFGSVLNGRPVALCNFLSLKRTIGLVESLQG